jgi:hypothetical protein
MTYQASGEGAAMRSRAPIAAAAMVGAAATDGASTDVEGQVAGRAGRVTGPPSRRFSMGGNISILSAGAVAAAAFALALAPSGAAHAAAAPIHFTFTESDSFTDTTSCTFPIAFGYQSRIVGTVWLDANGDFMRAMTEENTVATNSANGITLPETDHLVDLLNAAGYDKQVGLPIHIKDGGVVLRDAGYLLFNPDGSVALIHGPHPQLEGDTAALCAALTPAG